MVFGVATGTESAARWDFFVSYTQAERTSAEWIAWIVEESGYKVLAQEWDFVPGTNWVQRMQEGVSRADRTVRRALHRAQDCGGSQESGARTPGDGGLAGTRCRTSDRPLVDLRCTSHDRTHPSKNPKQTAFSC
jgi:TIR domain